MVFNSALPQVLAGPGGIRAKYKRVFLCRCLRKGKREEKKNVEYGVSFSVQVRESSGTATRALQSARVNNKTLSLKRPLIEQVAGPMAADESSSVEIRPSDIPDELYQKHGYVLKKEIGKGTFGKVYLAHLSPEKSGGKRFEGPLALKEVKFGDVKSEKYSRLLQASKKEAETMRRLTGHPYIVQLFEEFTDSSDSSRFFSMELADAGSLYDEVRKSPLAKGLSLPKVNRWFAQIVSAVNHMHTKGTCTDSLTATRRALISIHPQATCTGTSSCPTFSSSGPRSGTGRVTESSNWRTSAPRVARSTTRTARSNPPPASVAPSATWPLSSWP